MPLLLLLLVVQDGGKQWFAFLSRGHSRACERPLNWRDCLLRCLPVVVEVI